MVYNLNVMLFRLINLSIPLIHSFDKLLRCTRCIISMEIGNCVQFIYQNRVPVILTSFKYLNFNTLVGIL